MPMNPYTPELRPALPADVGVGVGAGAGVADLDAREFDVFAAGHDEIEIEAATWAARARNGLDVAGLAEMRAWIDADPRHAAAVEGMSATLGQLRQLPEDDVARLKNGIQRGELADQSSRVHKSPAHAASRPQKSERGRWWSGLGPLFPHAALAGVLMVMAGVGWVALESWRSLPTFEQAYFTQRGQQIVATLPDYPANGSTVELDTATRLDVRLFRGRREIHLKDGQAMFTVHADAERPFHVMAGALKITVTGTRFSVRHTASGLDAGKTVVLVEEGRVQVARASQSTGVDGAARNHESADAQEAPVQLAAGQMLVGDDSGHIGPVTNVPAAVIAQWRSGRINFDNTPLADALAEFERYGSTGLVVKDPAVARMAVGGSYGLQQARRFAEALPQLLPVRLVQRGDVTEIVLQQP